MQKKQQILIVDDERIHRRMLSDLLDNDYEVIIAKNGEQTLQRTEANSSIDLILLDIIMPGLDGYETCTRLKNNTSTSTIPVIFLSSKNEMMDKVKAFSLGGVDYITKPFQRDEVIARVKTHLSLVAFQKSLQEKNTALESEVKQRKKAEAEQQRLVNELKQALSEVKKISGLLPICSHCKKIRDDQGYWNRIEKYIGEHSEVKFSHGICPDCAEEHYPEFDLYDE